ncbi:MAG: hypothetical protein C4320_04065, partial [Armatimonadota bacterium]
MTRRKRSSSVRPPWMKCCGSPRRRTKLAAFAYRAVDGDGGRVSGTIHAETAADAESKLLGQNVVLLSLAPMAEGKAKAAPATTGTGPGTLFGRRKVSVQDAADVLRNLAVMAETGVPFVESLEAVMVSARTPTVADAIRTVRDAVVGGQSLSQAMRMAPEMFPVIVVDMVRIAEGGGRLDTALERAAELRKKILNAMMYPCVMLGVSVLTIGILILFVMPRFAQVFAQMKADVPWTTRLMLQMGDAAKANPVMAGVTFVGSLVGLVVLTRVPAVARLLGLLALRMPILGELLRRLALSRALDSIATLSAAGVPLLSCLEQGARVAGSGPIHRGLLRARDEVNGGRALSDALREDRSFPATLVQMVAVGERTGRLPHLMSRLADQLEEDVDARLKAAVA